MQETLETYVRSRARALGLNLSEVCRRSNISRQTLYSLGRQSKLPALSTLVSLAEVLQVHPLRLLQLMFDGAPMHRAAMAEQLRDDRSAFGRDVTFPDGSLVLPHERFTKTWEMQNAGKVAWEGRFLQCMDEEIVVFARTGEQLTLANNLQPDAQRIAIPTTLPGETVTLSMTFTAPDTPGTVLSYWKSVFADGTLCFPQARGLWCKVRVTSLASVAQAAR